MKLSYEEIVSMMQEQAECMRELEQNLEEVRGGSGEQGRRDGHH